MLHNNMFFNLMNYYMCLTRAALMLKYNKTTVICLIGSYDKELSHFNIMIQKQDLIEML